MNNAIDPRDTPEFALEHRRAAPAGQITRLLKDHRDIAGRIWTAIEEISRLEPFSRSSRQYLYRTLDALQEAKDHLAEALDRLDPDWAEADAEDQEPNTEARTSFDGQLVERRQVDDQIEALIDLTIQAMVRGARPEDAARRAVVKVDWDGGPVQAAANARLRTAGLIATTKDKAHYVASAFGGRP